MAGEGKVVSVSAKELFCDTCRKVTIHVDLSEPSDEPFWRCICCGSINTEELLRGISFDSPQGKVPSMGTQ